MTSAVRIPCTLSAENNNCSVGDKKKQEAAAIGEKEEAVAATKPSGIARHTHGDTGAPTMVMSKGASMVSKGASVVTSFSAFKRVPQRPSQPPPPPPCPSGDNAEEDKNAKVVGEGQFMMPSAARMTELSELHLQLPLMQQSRGSKYRAGQRSPCKLQTSKSHQSRYLSTAATGAGRMAAVSSSEIPIDIMQVTENGLEQTADVNLQKLRVKEDADETGTTDDASASVAVGSSKHADDCDHSTDLLQKEVADTTVSNDEVDVGSSSGGQLMKRSCVVIVEEASLDELMEKTEKLEKELRKQLDIKKQKTLANVRQEERIGVLEKTISDLQMKLAEAESELTKKDIKMAVIQEKTEYLAKRLKSTQDVLTKLESDYERVVEEKLEFKSLYIDSRLKSSEAIGDLTDEINRQIEAKRYFVRQAQQNISSRSANGLKKALATTSEYLNLKCERNRLVDKVQNLKTRMEAQDLYIEDLSSAVKELSRIIRHYKVSLPDVEEKDEAEQRKEDDDDHSSLGRCATMTDESSGEELPTFDLATEEKAEEIEYQPNEEDDRDQELEKICNGRSDSDCSTDTTEESTVLEFRTPISSPSSPSKSQTLQETADEDDVHDYDGKEEEEK